MKTIRIGLLGCGTVGQGLIDLIGRNRDVMARRSGVTLEVRRVLVRDLKRERRVDRALLTTKPDDILTHPDIDLVVELMGGMEPAHAYIRRALEAGRHVVTANKALLAEHGGELFRLAAAKKVQLGFEASVCGGIPVLGAIEHGLVANRIETLVGIVNGTCNFILTRMAEQGGTFEEALGEAKRLGFTEADPSLDIDGLDAAQKAVLLAELAFGVEVDPRLVFVEGIRALDPEDFRTAREWGYVLKHAAIARDTSDGIDVRVHPAFIPAVHPLAHVRNEFNAVFLQGDAVGEMMFVGKGAGSLPTASAVLSDIVAIAAEGVPEHTHVPELASRPVAKDFESSYYFRFPIHDRPGVIGLIATALGNHQVSISQATATLVEGTADTHGNVKIRAHKCRESQVRKAMESIARLPILTGKPVVIRVLE